METQIEEFIESIGAACAALSSIWLVGSRANGSATEKSDWDFLAFGSEEAHRFLQDASQFHRPDVDFLVVVNGEDFRCAWGEKDKSGSLSSWEWAQSSERQAEYTETKWVETEEEAKVVSKRRQAICVWQCKST